MKSKIIVSLLTMVIMIFSFSTITHAESYQKVTNTTTMAPRANVIETKYRSYKGHLQKRRWNRTQGYWVDPYWITISIS